ncbi:hypothetical protein BpHYR1_004328 [Brachionus plicatilis]|uniref:Uncharacterized protein n=1 Tax=Brachionus plicatilis TaxID=10195 RepID=A0A3M7SDM7_BRAPC|nr:hypothetical protein BpHYR1_004328 [Brachionus plicatilis]
MFDIAKVIRLKLKPCILIRRILQRNYWLSKVTYCSLFHYPSKEIDTTPISKSNKESPDVSKPKKEQEQRQITNVNNLYFLKY